MRSEGSGAEGWGRGRLESGMQDAILPHRAATWALGYRFDFVLRGRDSTPFEGEV